MFPLLLPDNFAATLPPGLRRRRSSAWRKAQALSHRFRVSALPPISGRAAACHPCRPSAKWQNIATKQAAALISALLAAFYRRQRCDFDPFRQGSA